MSKGQDPYYLIRHDIEETVTDLQQRLSRFHGLTAANPERRRIAKSVEEGCNSCAWQLGELEKAVQRASEDPQRFNLTPEELSSRQRWISSTRRAVEGMREALRTGAAAPLPPAEARAAASNDRFVNSHYETQQLMMRQHDEELDDIAQAVIRIGRQGREIGMELEEQSRMLESLDQDVDTTNMRLKAARKKMQEIIRKSGSNTQLCLVVTLSIILVIVAALAFS